MRPRIRPVSLGPDENGRGEVFEHPAFAQAHVGRVNGGAILMGSEFQHQHYIMLKFTQARIVRHLSNDWVSGSHRPFVEVAFTEAQWQQLTSSMNSLGVPCTLESLNGEMIPAIAPSEAKSEVFKREAQEAANEALKRLKALCTAIEDTKLSNAAKKTLIDMANSVALSLQNTLPYILDQFGEYMEDFVTKAKTEVNGYLQTIGAAESALPKLTDGEQRVDETRKRIKRGR